MPSNSAPFKYGAGSGLPAATSSAVTSTDGTPILANCNLALASRRVPEVTTHHRPFGIDRTKSDAPGITFTPS